MPLNQTGDPGRCNEPQDISNNDNSNQNEADDNAGGAATDNNDNVNDNQEAPVIQDVPDAKDTRAATDAPGTVEDDSIRCGCTDCTVEIWNEPASYDGTTGVTCGSRIEYMMGQGLTELNACRFIAGETGEYCSVCGPACDPDRCQGRVIPEFTEPPTLPPHTPPLEPETPLYCFRNYTDRVRWGNVWGNYTVEVKRHPNNEVCGPGGNRFSEDTVSLVDDELTLRFQKTDDGWVGSEVRVVLPADKMPYSYGNFRFSVQSIVTKDNETGEVNSTQLPPSIVLGMFTWDTTDKFDVNEYWSHEVDIEISRWGNRDIMDAQFVIQPPEEPHYQRFWTGPSESMDQGGHIYEFFWNPTNVTWVSDANGGQRLEYTTEQAITEGLTDRIQCLPTADIEVRMNLWSIDGTSQPMDMEDNQVVEVVIDSFLFEPNYIEGVEDGEFCSKHCQCLGDSVCVNGICTSVS